LFVIPPLATSLPSEGEDRRREAAARYGANVLVTLAVSTSIQLDGVPINVAASCLPSGRERHPVVIDRPPPDSGKYLSLAKLFSRRRVPEVEELAVLGGQGLPVRDRPTASVYSRAHSGGN